MTAVSDATDLFVGPGEVRALCRALDWSETPLGAPERWSPALRTVVRTALDSPFPINLWCGAELVLIYNDAYRRVLGAKHPGALGRPGRAVWTEIWESIAGMFEQIRGGGPPVFAEDSPFLVERAATAPGEAALEEAWFTFGLSPVRDEAGTIVAFLNVVSETTGRVLAERATEAARADAERAEARLRDAFHQAPSFFAILRGPSFVFELANDAYLELVGRPGADIIGRGLFDALPEIVGQGFDRILGDVYRTGTPFVARTLPVQLRPRAGAGPEERFVDVAYVPLVAGSGEITGILAHGSDVTEEVVARREVERLLAASESGRRELAAVNEQLEEQQVELELTNQQLQDQTVELEVQTEALAEANAELAASEARLRDVFEQAPVAVAVLTGPDHVYTVASPRYREFVGGRELVGLPVREALAELDAQGIFDVLDRVYLTGEPYFAAERSLWLRAGGDGALEERIFDLGYQPLRDASGRVYALASVTADVTGRVRARRELEVARAAAEQARTEAEQANQVKAEFLATMSHELRTPLNAIGGYAELIQLGVHGPVTEAQGDALARIQTSQRHLLGLINQVLNYSRIEAGVVRYEVRPVMLKDALATCEALTGPQMRAKRLGYSFDGDALAVLADEEKLQQILLNLLSNAVKFTEPGGAISVRAAQSGPVVAVAVADTGRGIPADRLESVFEPFVQVDARLTRAQEGVGLGLAISRDLARGMGGDLTAESEVGVGSTFTLTLPAG